MFIVKTVYEMNISQLMCNTFVITLTQASERHACSLK